MTKKKQIKKKCKQCKKIFYVIPSLHKRKFCNRKCRDDYFKKYKISVFFDSTFQSEMGKRAAKKHPTLAKRRGKIGGKKAVITNKKNKSSFWNSELQSKLGKRGGKAVSFETHSKAGKIGGPIGGKIGGLKAAKTHERNKTGFWNSEFQKEMSKRGAKANRKNKPYIFYNIHFDSNQEREFAMNIHYQIEKLKENINYQVNIDSKFIDFFIKRFKCFIEFHPYNILYDKDDIKLKKYYKQRRKILDVNGYKNYKLLIIP